MKTTQRMKTKQSSGRINAKVQVFPSHYSLNRQVPALSCKGENNDRQHPAFRGDKSRRGHSQGGSTMASLKNPIQNIHELRIISTAYGAVQAKAGMRRPGLWASSASDLEWVTPLLSVISFSWEMKPPAALSQERLTQRRSAVHWPVHYYDDRWAPYGGGTPVSSQKFCDNQVLFISETSEQGLWFDCQWAYVRQANQEYTLPSFTICSICGKGESMG